MTHWVIIKKNGRIYAGVDMLRSGPDYPSELSGTKTMPGVHMETTANKLVQYTQSGKVCVICCAGKSYPLNRKTKLSNSSKDMTRILTNDILPSIKFSSLTDAESLLKAVMKALTSKYIIDENDNSVLLGCGFIDNTVGDASSSLSMAYYDSRSSKIKAAHEECLNSELVERDLLAFEFDLGLIIRDEINTKSMERSGRVGRDTNDCTLEYSYVEPTKSKPISLSSKSGIFSKKTNEGRKPAAQIPESSNTESDQQSSWFQCVIS